MIDVYGEIITPFIRTKYNYDTNAASLQSGLHCSDETMAQQQFIEECDINTIVNRFGLTGQLPQSVQMPFNGDFEEIIDYQTALNLMLEADKAFMQMPSAVRERFQNDPGKFVDFASDPANVEQCREWGLARPVEAPRGPIEVRVIPEVQGEPKTP